MGHKSSLPVSHQACVWSRWYRRWAGLADTLCFVHTDMKVKWNQMKKGLIEIYKRVGRVSSPIQDQMCDNSVIMRRAKLQWSHYRTSFVLPSEERSQWSDLKICPGGYIGKSLALERRLTIMTGLRMEGKCRSSNFPCVPKAPFFYSFGW